MASTRLAGICVYNMMVCKHTDGWPLIQFYSDFFAARFTPPGLEMKSCLLKLWSKELRWQGEEHPGQGCRQTERCVLREKGERIDASWEGASFIYII